MKKSSDINSSISRPKPRPEIEQLKSYSAPLEGRRSLLRLDFNENTIGPSPKVLDAIRKISKHLISIYPEYNGLKKAVVENLNDEQATNFIKPSQVGIFNGVDAAINSIFHAFGDRGETLLTTAPTFGYYTPCAHMQGMRIISLPYEGEKFKFPIDKISKYLKHEHPKLLFICNPNNPTGSRLDPVEILRISSLSPTTLIVIDELYEAFTGDTVLPFLDFNKVPNVVVLRSLSKTAGLAGLRIGFAFGQMDIINQIRSVTGPYDVNSFAVAAAFAALSDQDYVNSYVKKVMEAKMWITQQLIDHKVKHHIDGGNFFLIWPNSTSDEVASQLKRKGILIRDMKGKNLIDGSLRVSIGTIPQMQRFWESFRDIEKIELT